MKKHACYNTIAISFSLLLIFLTICSCSQMPEARVNKWVVPTDTAYISNMLLLKEGATMLRSGDLVTRSDDDFESLSLQNFSSRERIYSHSGIAFKEDDKWMVYHSMAGAENPSGSIKREPFDSFANPVEKTGFGIFRYQLSPTEIAEMHQLYQRYFQEKLPFDKNFNLKSDDSMYCSEIIYKALKKVTFNRIALPTSTLENFKPKLGSLHSKNLFFKKFEYVGIDDLYLNSFCQAIAGVKYK